MLRYIKKLAFGLAGATLVAGAAQAAFTDAQFGQYQVADSQWDTTNCTTTATCNIYSKNPGTAYQIPFSNGQVDWGVNGDRYIAFVPNMNGQTQDSTNPWEMVLFEANGTQVQSLGTGHALSAGADASGNIYFFFVGNDNWTGQLFSASLGMNDTAGLSFTGTLNPTITDLNTLSANMATAPLAAGETYTAGGGGGTDTGTDLETMSVLERVLDAAGQAGYVKLNGVFANIAQNVATTNPATGEILTEIDGRVINVMTGVQTATASVGETVLAVDQVRVDLGDISTTVLGAVNTGSITLGTNQSVSEAVGRSSSALAITITQIGGSADTGALVLNMASNTMSILGSVQNTFDALNGSVGNVSTTVLGSVNTGTITSGINQTVQGIRSDITGG